ncbi:MAG TPA: LysR family transcriptional regulator [Candidatus Sulfotelmatobacter sp.]|jgi:DNA-binding transcriptional LysR family regulator|nr:LysR family transcriptional regulator [Candidatus Sulfotelmatobacter sp.]
MSDALDLAFFVRLSRHPSLASAAQEMGVTPPAVSRRLAALEQRLGTRLLNRTTRRQSLTPEGERYLQEGRRILQDIEQLEHELGAAKDVPRGTLRINSGFGFGRRHIAPAIAEFVRHYPDVEILLHLTDRPQDLAEAGMDIGIRFGVDGSNQMIARKIAANRRILCASPDYLAARRAPDVPHDLRGHHCITIRENDLPADSWHLVSPSGQVTLKVRGPLATNHGEVAVDWALKGHGILLRSLWDVAPYLREGRLLRVLPEWHGGAADIYAVYLQRDFLSAKVRLFLDFLAERFADYRVTSKAW